MDVESTNPACMHCTCVCVHAHLLNLIFFVLKIAVIYMFELSTVGGLLCSCVVVCYKMLLYLIYHVCLKKTLGSAYSMQVDLYFANNRWYNYKFPATDVIHILTKWAEEVQEVYLTNTDGDTRFSRKIVPPKG